MAGIFLKIVNMSISACWIVFAIILLRVILKKAPKWINCILWGIAGLRFVMPFSLESVFSLIPSTETITKVPDSPRPQIDSGVSIIDNQINGYLQGNYFEGVTRPMGNFVDINTILSIVWIVGIVALLIYTLVSFLRLKSKIGTAVLLRDNIYQSEAVSSPFVLGIIKPKIYLPFNMNDQDMEHVIAHEQAHIRRKDHLWKPLGFLILTLHWFNPIVWLGYILLCRDIELACDEKVVKELNNEQRADYSQALLTCSVNRRMIAACPLAFGEVGVKDRVKSVLNYKKPAFWIIVVAIIASIAAALCFLTNPVSDKLANIEGSKLDTFLYEQTAVMASDGETHRFIGSVEDEILRELFDIRISKKEVSLSRDEERDKTNTLILNMVTEEQEILTSYIGGIHVHFNADFSEVWVNDGVKPTFSYKVKNPDKAKEIYESIVSNVKDTENNTEIDQLKEKYPQFFNVSTDGGLKVYIWQMAKDDYRCYLINRSIDALADQGFAFEVGATIEEMRAILSTYNINKEDVVIHPVINPLSSYHYKIDDAYTAKITDLFWKESNLNTETYDGSSIPKLNVFCEGITAEAVKGTTTWTFINADGMMQTINGDSAAHPLDRIDYLLPLALQVNRSDNNPLVAKLKFNVKPDNIKVNSWFFGENGKTKPFDADVDGFNITLNAGKEACVYEVIATWNSSTKYNGIVRYSFCVVENTEPYFSPSNQIYDVVLSYANWTDDSKIYIKSLNLSKMQSNSIQHLPIYKFDTAEDLKQFKSTFGDVLTMNGGWDEVPSFNDVTSKYDNKFFDKNSLILVYIPATNSTHRFGLGSIGWDENSFCINVVETTGAEFVDNAMAGWFLTVAVAKDSIATCIEFDADLNNEIKLY